MKRTREDQLDTHQHVTAMLEQAKAALDVGLLSEIKRNEKANEITKMQLGKNLERGAIVVATFAILMHDVEKEFSKYGYDFNKFTKKMLAAMDNETEFFHRILRLPYKKRWWRRSR